jgi:glutaconate CoA-transferase subunit A
VVEDLVPRPGAVHIPGWVIDYVALAPAGARPSYAQGITERDNDFYREWDPISRDRDAFSAWMDANVLARPGVA